MRDFLYWSLNYFLFSSLCSVSVFLTYFLKLFLSFIFLFFFKFYLFILFHLWLCWVFVSVCGLSLVAASGGHSSSRCAGLSLSWPLLLRSTGSRRAGSAIVAHGLSRSAACGIFPDQGWNPCPLHWQADSQPLRHQGSPHLPFFYKVFYFYFYIFNFQEIFFVLLSVFFFYSILFLSHGCNVFSYLANVINGSFGKFFSPCIISVSSKLLLFCTLIYLVEAFLKSIFIRGCQNSWSSLTVSFIVDCHAVPVDGGSPVSVSSDSSTWAC